MKLSPVTLFLFFFFGLISSNFLTIRVETFGRDDDTASTSIISIDPTTGLYNTIKNISEHTKDSKIWNPIALDSKTKTLYFLKEETDCEDGNRCTTLGSYSFNDDKIKYCSGTILGRYFSQNIYFSSSQQKIYAIRDTLETIGDDDDFTVLIFSIDINSCKVNNEMSISFKNPQDIAVEVVGSILIGDILYMLVITEFNYIVSANINTKQFDKVKIKIEDKPLIIYTSLNPYKSQFITIRDWTNITMINPKNGAVNVIQNIQVPSKDWPPYVIDMAMPEVAIIDEQKGLLYVQYTGISNEEDCWFSIASVNIETGVIEYSPNINLFDKNHCFNNFLKTGITDYLLN